MSPTSRSGARAQQTHRRRAAILDAALECFSTIGYDQATLADIRERAGASTGSIYHHFGSKERIAAALYLEGLRQSQEAVLAALQRTRTVRTGVAAQVGAYIDWVVGHRELARFLFDMRRAPFLEDDEAWITTLNQQVHARGAEWIEQRVEEGRLPRLDPALRWALIFGPCRHWAGSWLRGTTSISPDEAKRRIATAVHAGLQALL